MARVLTAFAFVLACTSVIQAQTVDLEPVDATTSTASSQPAAAQAAQSPEREKQPSTYDKIWRFTEWYQDQSNPVVQRVLFSGRYQHEYTVLDADQGDLDEWNVRRMRRWPESDALPHVHPSRRGRAQSAGKGSAVPAFHRFLSAVEPERAIRGDARQARRSVHDGRGDVVQGPPRHRPKQLDQQHLVSAGVHSGRQRFGQGRALGLPCRRVLGRRNEPRIRQVQWQASSPSASSATILRIRSARRKRCWPATTCISVRIRNNTFTR